MGTMIRYRSIGIIHTPFKEPKGTPVQPPGGRGIEGTVEVFPEYAEGITDLSGFSHIILIYHFHLVRKANLMAKPFMDNAPHGVFAIRSPGRPNPIGLSAVRLSGVEGNVLRIQDIDIVDGTPLLDIKPYVPDFDPRRGVEIGWYKDNIHKMLMTRDDGRFATRLGEKPR